MLVISIVPFSAGCIPFFFFFNNTATPEIYTLPLHDALPISTGVYTPSDNVHSTSTSPVSNTVTVGLRATSTVVTCSPASVAVGQQVTCTVFVKDNISPGTASTPAGSVAITKGGTDRKSVV